MRRRANGRKSVSEAIDEKGVYANEPKAQEIGEVVDGEVEDGN